MSIESAAQPQTINGKAVQKRQLNNDVNQNTDALKGQFEKQLRQQVDAAIATQTSLSQSPPPRE